MIDISLNCIKAYFFSHIDVKGLDYLNHLCSSVGCFVSGVFILVPEYVLPMGIVGSNVRMNDPKNNVIKRDIDVWILNKNELFRGFPIY